MNKETPMQRLRIARLLVTALVCTGCAGALGNPVASMSPEQLKEWVKQKDASCYKLTGIYLGTTFTATSVSVDKGIPPGAGSVKISPDCSVEITAEPKPATK
jgi:hypothetical protein